MIVILIWVMMRRYLVALALVFGSTVSAQTTDFERILLPITVVGEVPGAFGSRWTSQLSITNTAGQRVAIFGYSPYPSGCLILCPPVPSTPSGITFLPTVAAGSSSQGAILRVDRQYASAVRFQLRVQDVSRQSQTWGTEIPVVRESDLFTEPIELLNVPLGPAFRATLRIYDPDGRVDTHAALRFYRVNTAIGSPLDFLAPQPAKPDEFLGERPITLAVERRAGESLYDLGYAEIINIAGLPELQGADRVRIEIRPLTPAVRLWAFVSVTNNETQHVTTITPR